MKNLLFILFVVIIVGCSDGEMYYEYYDNSQATLSGLIKNGKEEGVWVYMYPDGSKKMEVTYRSGVQQGPCKMWYNNLEMNTGQLRVRGDYKNGKKEGKFQHYHINGNLEAEGSFSEGNEIGLWKTYFDNGKMKKEVKYIEGSKEGEFTIWHSNGKVSRKGVYVNNKVEGIYKVWDEEGVFVEEELYKNGELIK